MHFRTTRAVFEADRQPRGRRLAILGVHGRRLRTPGPRAGGPTETKPRCRWPDRVPVRADRLFLSEIHNAPPAGSQPEFQPTSAEGTRDLRGSQKKVLALLAQGS